MIGNSGKEGKQTKTLCERTDLPYISKEYFSLQVSAGWNMALKQWIEDLSLKTTDQKR